MKSHTSLVAQQTRLSEWADLIRDCQNPSARNEDRWMVSIIGQNFQSSLQKQFWNIQEQIILQLVCVDGRVESRRDKKIMV